MEPECFKFRRRKVGRVLSKNGRVRSRIGRVYLLDLFFNEMTRLCGISRKNQNDVLLEVCEMSKLLMTCLCVYY